MFSMYDLVNKLYSLLRKFFAVSYRVEEATHYLSPLVELVSLQRREDLLYKKAFLRRCENLRRAETEVLSSLFVLFFFPNGLHSVEVRIKLKFFLEMLHWFH